MLFVAFCLSLLIVAPQAAGSTACPKPCKCSRSLKTVNCRGKGLHTIPGPFPHAAVSIDLSKNLLNSVEDNSFVNLTQLQRLVLSNNKLTGISKDAFVGCGNLIELRLASNSLQRLYTSTFYRTPNLQTLDVSQNQLASIPALRTSKLQNLYLSHNQFVSFKFPNDYKTAKQLKRITLSNNIKVGSINKSDFVSLSSAVSLTRLYMSRCDISVVEAGSFAPFAGNLASLSLSHNLIDGKTLQTILQDFANSKSLKSLDLSDLQLHGVVADTTFTALGNDNRLATLDLSDNRHLTKIESGAFSLLKHLTMLAISRTSLDEQPQLKSNLKLTTLDMSRNTITHLYQTRFPRSLTRLLLNGNGITKLQTSLFAHLLKVQTLTLNNNKIDSLETGALIGLNRLRTLDLSNNELSSLPADAFSSLGQLVGLDLSQNNIRYINLTVFKTTQNLAKVDLVGNNMRSFNRRLFTGLTKLTELHLSRNMLGMGFSDPRLDFSGFLSKLSRLKLVDMSSNSIAVLPAQMVAGTPELDTLNLASNNIYSWDTQHTFKDVGRLRKLLLNNNKLALFNESSFDDLKNLTDLDLTNNPFACTCDMQAFRNWLKNTKVHVNNSQSYTCASPPALLGTHVMDYKLTTIQCLPEWVWIVTGVGAGVIALLLIFCISYRCRWRIRYQLYKCSKHLCYNHGGRYQTLSSDERCQYAAFVSHCEKCQEFVLERILPAIDNIQEHGHRGDYPLVHRAIFSGSGSKCADLDNALSTSACTVVVLCKHYSKCRRCELELRESLHLLEHRKRPIIIVASEEGLHMKYIPKVLHSAVISGDRFIEWSNQSEQVPLDRLKGKLADVWSVAAPNAPDGNAIGDSDD